MKRYIRSFKEIDNVNFANSLVKALKQVLPKNCWPKVDLQSRYTDVVVENIDSTDDLQDRTVDALNKLGYDVYFIKDADEEGYDIAAVKGDAFVKLQFDVSDYFNNGQQGYITLKFNNGNVLFQDWY